MKFRCEARRTTHGQWSMQHDGPEVGHIEVAATTREEAAKKMRGEIRYRLELCPCSGESYQHIEVEIQETAGQ